MWRSDLRDGIQMMSALKKRSSLPVNGLFGRSAPLATVLMMPCDCVHQVTMRLVSVSLVRRRRMAGEFSTEGNEKEGRCYKS